MTYQEFIDSILSLDRERPKNVVDTKDGYENHHIIPKCMGGTNKKDNLIRLTYAEHFKAHVLLFKENPNNSQLAFVVHSMCSERNIVDMVETAEFDIISNDISMAKDVWRNSISGANNYNSKAVINIDTMQIFNSASEAKRKIGGNIRGCCKGVCKSANGYRWMYLEDWEQLTNLERLNKKTSRIGIPCGSDAYQAIPIINIDTEEVFPTIKEAAKITKCNAGSIQSCIKGRTLSAGGYRWMSLEKWGLLNEDEKKCYKSKRIGHASGGDVCNSKSVICLEAQKIFDNITEAAKYIGLKGGAKISMCCKGKRNTAGGCHWMYLDEWNILAKNKQNNILNNLTYYEHPCGANSPRAHAVICLETKEVFSTCTEAGKSIGKRSGDISAVCRGKCKTCGGYHWMYYDEYLEVE